MVDGGGGGGAVLVLGWGRVCSRSPRGHSVYNRTTNKTYKLLSLPFLLLFGLLTWNFKITGCVRLAELQSTARAMNLQHTNKSSYVASCPTRQTPRCETCMQLLLLLLLLLLLQQQKYLLTNAHFGLSNTSPAVSGVSQHHMLGSWRAHRVPTRPQSSSTGAAFVTMAAHSSSCRSSKRAARAAASLHRCHQLPS